MLMLTAPTTRVVAAADGLRCAEASDGRVSVTGSYPSGQGNLDATTCRPSATLRCAALVLLFPNIRKNQSLGLKHFDWLKRFSV
jgi:hypothetical protein